jgi:hypothetical protein
MPHGLRPLGEDWQVENCSTLEPFDDGYRRNPEQLTMGITKGRVVIARHKSGANQFRTIEVASVEVSTADSLRRKSTLPKPVSHRLTKERLYDVVAVVMRGHGESPAPGLAKSRPVANPSAGRELSVPIIQKRQWICP